MKKETVQLTEQQGEVVAHEDGAALVFAVAGAGKTTAMVHRIARLVREKRAAPHQILAASFARENIRDLKNALAEWDYCRAVDVRTLHSLGRLIISEGQTLGYFREIKLNGDVDDGQRLLSAAISVAYREDASFKRELDGMDRQDFLAYVASCKGNFQYADLEQAELPEAGLLLAQQAEAPSRFLSWYLDLYQLVERVRKENGRITFDDMLLTGWEGLLRYPDLLLKLQGRYQFLLIDEFQDVNWVQAELLGLIAASHNNYMVIGDDDQMIYEWRGAAPDYILQFESRYGAKKYLIDENFRCPIAPLLLANRVIKHNDKRQVKELHLTKGLGGEAVISEIPGLKLMSERIVDRVEQLASQETPLDEIAILVRINAQTPPIEQELIRRGIPYRVSQPFYERVEIESLIEYGRLAWLEQRLLEKKEISRRMIQQGQKAWRVIQNKPKRYISGEVARQVHQQIGQRPLSQILHQLSGRVEPWLADHLTDLADLIFWLAGGLEQPADQLVRELERRLDYKEFWRQSAGLAQTGEGRAIAVDAFISYAAGLGSFLACMSHLQELAKQKAGQGKEDGRAAVQLSTIHKAKGLEWSAVIIPQVNDTIYPFQGDDAENIEEERRLFYVALTRSKRDIYLYLLHGEQESRFLRQAGWQQLFQQAGEIRMLLSVSAEEWQEKEIVQFVKGVRALNLNSYFRYWWAPESGEKERVAHVVQSFLTAVLNHGVEEEVGLFRSDLILWQLIYPLREEELDQRFAELNGLELKKRRRAIREKRPLPKAPPLGKDRLSVRMNRVREAEALELLDAVRIYIEALEDSSDGVRWLAESKLREVDGAQVRQALGELGAEGEKRPLDMKLLDYFSDLS